MIRRKENIVDETGIVSKSQRKRDAQELKFLALKLIGLSASRLAQVPLDEQVRDAVNEARLIRSNVARKRQMLYLAKLLRRIDATEIFATIESFDKDSHHLTARQHRCEAWRDFLLASGDEAVGQLLERHQNVDVQALRQLLRNADREMKADKPPAAARSLFRLLRDLDVIEPLPSLQV